MSFDPRFTDEGQPTRFYRNSFEVTRRPNFDRSPPTIGRPSFTKLHPSVGPDGGSVGPSDIDFYQNTLVGDAEVAKGAPQGSGVAYPRRVRWRNNVMISRAGPIVRHTGTAADDNLFEGNLYSQLEPGRVFENWALPVGQRASFTTLAAARASAAGQAAGWETQGLQGRPELAVDSAPPLPAGWPDSVELAAARDRGAFERAPLRVDQVDASPTGWIHVRGRGFALGKRDPRSGRAAARSGCALEHGCDRPRHGLPPRASDAARDHRRAVAEGARLRARVLLLLAGLPLLAREPRTHQAVCATPASFHP